jgi:hypothetical protein
MNYENFLSMVIRDIPDFFVDLDIGNTRKVYGADFCIEQVF